LREKYQWPEAGIARLEISPLSQILLQFCSSSDFIRRFRAETVMILEEGKGMVKVRLGS
jgi:hypothetical protein